MKKATLILALTAFATTAFAQTTPSTEVKVRDNGTTKVVSKTGRTDAGEAIHDTKMAGKNVAHKTGHAMKRGAHKTSHAIKHGAAKMEAKTE
ncbi:MAG: hypothetical protein M3Y54_09735 [Bacteroidota bacterium]|nr:hypothetical protein [Bacteroidota bacterium]